MSIQPRPYYNFKHSLAAECRCIDAKHEYVVGQVFAMAGAAFNHNLIGSNLASGLRQQLKSRSFIAPYNATNLPIQTGNACTYPDIVVLCDKPASQDGRQVVLTDGTLVAVFVPPSTEGSVHNAKSATHRDLPGVVPADRPGLARHGCLHPPTGKKLAARSLHGHRHADSLRDHLLHRPAARGLPKDGVPVCYGYVRPAISASSLKALP